MLKIINKRDCIWASDLKTTGKFLKQGIKKKPKLSITALEWNARTLEMLSITALEWNARMLEMLWQSFPKMLHNLPWRWNAWPSS
jgi:hypothetical protein